MKQTLLFFATLILALNVSAQKARKALFIIADGIPADVIEKLHTPNLNKIVAVGAYMRAHVGGDKDTYNQTPTISAVGYNSLLTGTWVNKHNVWDNDIKAPDYNYPTIFRLLKDQYPAKKIAVYSSWLDNRTKLVGDGMQQTGNLKVDYHADGFELDTVNFKHDKPGLYMHLIDERITDEAVKGIKSSAPDLTWVYLEYTDDMGHRYGDSPQYYEAVELMDKQVGRIWDAIQYREKNFGEEWEIFITTDHGRSEKDGRGHGGQSTRQRSTWIVTNAHPRNDYARYFTPGIVDIMPTIARFMHIDIPQATRRELDGTALIGPVSVAGIQANYFQNGIDLSWKALAKDEQVKIWISATNNVKTGQPDEYKLMSTVPVEQEHAYIKVNEMPSGFYKICIEGKYNTINKWVVIQ